MTAITQGDPTEPNIAYPLTWLDFEHAGRNTIAGEVANLLWYLLGLGGWLVPRYRPHVYQRTLRHRLPPVATPVVGRLEVDTRRRRVEIDYRWEVGAGRAAAIETVVDALHGPLGDACGPGPVDTLTAIRPFLLTRMLGVLPLTALGGNDAAVCLATLAQVHHRLDLSQILSELTVPMVAA